MDDALPPPAATLNPAAPPSVVPGAPPGRLAVFGRVLWRSVVLAVVGGAVVGAVFAVPFLFFDDESDLGTVGLVAYVGAFLGLLLGVLAGGVLGVVAARWLVPYRGAATTRKIIRWSATAVVFVALAAFLANVSTAPLTVLGTAGAWLASPFVVNWYIRAMEPGSDEA